MRKNLTKTDPQPSEADLLTLIHELQMRQIELEMQNEKLISERGQAEKAFREREENKRSIILETAMDGFCVSDIQGNLLEVNKTYCRMTGYDRQELLSMRIPDLEVVETEEDTAKHLEKIISLGEDRFETRHRRKDGSIFDAEISVQYQPIKGGRLVSFIHDITARKTAETYREMTREILQILNAPGDIPDLMKCVLTVLKTGTGFDAVGIRLQHGDDFPCIAQSGFSPDFMLTEDTLVARKKDGEVCRDKNGNVRLECTCGMVISGNVDPSYPLLTSGGSWWTNDSSSLLSISPDRDARFRPRNRCIHEGYASVALVPIQNNDRNFGLLQFNDRIKERFTRTTVEKLEGIASHIGAAIMRKQAEATLSEHEKRRLAILDTAMDGFWLFDKHGCLLEVNETYCRMTGYSAKELLTMHINDLEIIETARETDDHILKVIVQGEDRFETRHRRKDGSIFDVEVSVQYQQNDGGQFVAFLHDITERKRAEEALIDSEHRYRALFDESTDAIMLIDVLSGRYLDCNPMTERLTGYTREEIAQMKTGMLLPLPRKEELVSNREIIMSGRVLRSETEILTKGGTLVPVEFNASLVTINNKQHILSMLHDISERKASELALKQSEERVRLKLQSILSPEGSIASLELSDIIDTQSIQSLMDNLYELVQVPMAIIDMGGNVLLGVGWQDICSKFHRIHPETCKGCIESDVQLTQGIADGEYKLYKCKNNMWDLATPIIIGGEHKGNLFMGQFFFDNEPIDYQLFRKQAKQFGFNEREYMEALDRVPIFSQQKLDRAKAFFLNLSHSMSKLSYSNIKLARAIAQQKKIEDALIESEEFLEKAQEIAHLGSWSLDLTTNQLTWSDEIYRIFGLQPQEFSATYEGFLEAVHPEDREAVHSAYFNSIAEGGEGNYEIEHRIVSKNTGEIRHVYEKCEHIRDESGKVVRSVGMVHDITRRRAKEEALRKLNQTLLALSKSSQAMSLSVDEADYLEQVCKIVVEDTDFAMVWIGYAEDDEAKTVRPVASAGFKDDYLEKIKVSWGDSEIGRGPTGTAIRAGKMSMCNNMLTDPAFLPWRENALKQGFASSVVFPLKTGETTFGAITIYSREPESFLDVELKMLAELANDLAHGITTIRLRKAHQLAEEALNKSHSELEMLVRERTRELQITNDLLNKEIIARKQQEENLRLAEEKYRTVADFTYGWEYWLDQKDNILYCSPSCERITGYESSAFIQNPRLLQDIIYHEDLKVYLDHKQKENLAQERNYEIQYRIFHLDGSIRWIGHVCQPIFDKSGRFIGNRGSNRDITGRKEIEQLLKTSNRKYELLSANITDGIFICRNGCFEYVNQALNSIFGYENHEMEGLPFKRIIKPEYQDEVEHFLTLTSSSNQNLNLEIECIKKDLSTVFVEILSNYVANERTVYGVIHDITEKKQIQTNIVKAIILTEERERAYFSKELHDGLGPLLSTIKLYLQWSQRPKSNKSREEVIFKAEEILEDALSTVKEISNKLSPHLLMNYGLISAVQSFIDKLKETSGIRIEFESNTSRRMDIEIESAIYRAIIECINNTIKYARAKNITILISDLGSQLQVEYKDDGIGFDVDETLVQRKGLGLFNLQNRIETIGGKITLFSNPGQGVAYKIIVNL